MEDSRVPRHSERASISAEVQLRRSGELNFTVEAYDLSEQGCKLEFVERPRLGETVWVKFPGLEALESKVRWTHRAAVGLQFSRPMDPRVLQHLLQRLR